MKIALLGDIAFFGKYSLKNNPDLFEYFKEVSTLLKSYDLVIGNLETPFVSNQKEYGYKSAYIKSDVVNSTVLKYLNIDIVNLANNHIYDYGEEGYELTKKILDENEISYFGVENKQFTLVFENNKIAVQGYCCYSTNPLGINSEKIKGINELNYSSVKENLSINKAKGYFNIIGFHCGQEHVNFPNFDHVLLGRKLAETAPYVFYGHHPHVAQGIETFKESLLAYSLGNFCFDDVYTKKSKEPLIKQTENNKESFILELTVENNILIDHKVIPIYLGDKKMELGSRAIYDKIKKYSEYLSTEKTAYIRHRTKLIHEYIKERKLKRNFNWYVKRMNLTSVFMLLNSRKNAKKYDRCLKKHL